MNMWGSGDKMVIKNNKSLHLNTNANNIQIKLFLKKIPVGV